MSTVNGVGSDPPVTWASLGRRSPPHRLGALVLLLGALATLGLSWTAWSVDQRTERHLLALQVKDAGSLLAEIQPIIQAPLTSALEVALVTGGSGAQFSRFVSAEIKTKRPFVSMSLWRITGGSVTPIAVVGSVPLLSPTSPQGAAFLKRAAKVSTLDVAGPFGTSTKRLGYAVGAQAQNVAYAVYAESPLATQKRSPVEQQSGFSDLNYALYLGPTAAPSALVQTTADALPLRGKTATATVPFGTTHLTLVATPIGSLEGWLPQNLPWLIAVAGSLATLIAASVAERLVHRRRFAEDVAVENERLYGEQRTVAVTLQHALLPSVLPEPPGAEIAVRYLPGSSGVEIGGDWYDFIETRNGVLLVVGDVSGHGLRAATVMASLRYAIRAYAALGDSPSAVLDKLANLVDVARDGHFATLLLVHVDLKQHEITLCNAGHPPLLVVDDADAHYIHAPIGPPVGVQTDRGYESMTITVPSGATLLAFTDGLIERQGEHLDLGTERMRSASSTGSSRTLDDLLDDLLITLIPNGSRDDVALVGLRLSIQP